jgi:hypothetical protein
MLQDIGRRVHSSILLVVEPLMPDSQSLTVEWWGLDRVRPYEQNPRVIPDAAIEKVAASINAFGWRQPIVVDDDGIILAGHTRYQAAMRLGLECVPVHVASGLSPEAARAYRLADNRTHEEARWHPDTLNLELHELGATGFELALTGFDPLQLLGESPRADTQTQQPSMTLAERFGIPPFSVFNAREGWWQARKRAWIDIGIRSELGRGAPIGGAPMPIDRAKANKSASYRDQDKLKARKHGKRTATPGGSPLPAANYSKSKARGDGRGRPMPDG